MAEWSSAAPPPCGDGVLLFGNQPMDCRSPTRLRELSSQHARPSPRQAPRVAPERADYTRAENVTSGACSVMAQSFLSLLDCGVVSNSTASALFRPWWYIIEASSRAHCQCTGRLRLPAKPDIRERRDASTANNNVTPWRSAAQCHRRDWLSISERKAAS